MYAKLLISGLIFCVICFAAKAQRPQQPVAAGKNNASNLHRKFIRVTKGITHIDSLSILPESFSVVGISDSSYLLDYVNGDIRWKKPPSLDSVLVVYRTFPFRLNSMVKRLNYDSIEGHFLVQQSTFRGDKNGDDNFFNFGNITYNGSFGRGLTFGNTQSAVVTSNLNLQISGYLADSIQITAALTDNNIPVQPDGTTAQLSDFDKIFLEFKKKNWALSMGDIDLRQNQNYFLSFYQRLQGANFETTQNLGDGITNKTLVSAAIGKGIFNRNIFQGQEGNQGPYKLQGANNELYFVVLAGTEKVYLDGQLMQRGADQDYIINYNTAEVTFTSRRMITQDSRIQVEFTYSNQSYLNVNLYLANETDFNKKLKIRFAVFNNSDSRNSPINQTLDADQQKFLFSLGDSINKAFYPYAPIDTLGPGKVLYQKVDTTYIAANGLVVHDSIYEYSVNPNITLYNLSFVDVGLGNGDYVPNLNGINGNVYQWIAPVNGQKQGEYEAAQFLVTPKTERVITLGADYSLSKETQLTADIAASHYDPNTLSTLQKNNVDGYSARFQLKNVHPLNFPDSGLKLTTILNYENVDANFHPVEPFRSVEFTRDWGLPLASELQAANEQLYSASFQLDDKKKNFVKYEFDGYDRGSSFKGIRNSVSSNREWDGWHFNENISLMNGWSDTANGYYFKPDLEIFKTFPRLHNYTFGVSYQLEDNVLRNQATDTVSISSFEFQVLQAYLKSPAGKKDNWSLNFTQHTNYYPVGTAMVKGDLANSINLNVQLMSDKHEQLKFNATYRDLDVVDTTLSSQRSDKTMLAKVEYLVNEWKGFLKGNIYYEVGSGQVQQQNYSYLQVPAGTGQYEWIDLNHDGIQQLNEFFPAQFQDQADFIRIYTPTNNYVKANYNTFNFSFSLDPKTLIDLKKSEGFLNAIARFTLQTSLQLNQKEQANGFVQLNPLKGLPLDDTTLITRAAIFTNTLSFNKSSTKWGFDVINAQNSGKTLLTYGYESKNISQWTFRGRLNLSKEFILNGTMITGINQLNSSSTNIDSNDYNLKQFSIEPDLTYTQKSNLRILIGYKLSNKLNGAVYGGQLFTSNALNTEVKYNLLQNTSILAKFTLNTIDFTLNKAPASTSSPVSYIILEGLQPGKNYLWSIDFTKKLGGNLELSLQYEGRKPGDTQIVHTGRATLRAIL